MYPTSAAPLRACRRLLLALICLLAAAGPGTAVRVGIERQDVSISNVCRIAFSPDGRLIATALAQKDTLLLFDAATGVIVRRLGNPATGDSDAPPVWLGFVKGGTAIVVADMRGTVRSRDVASGKVLRTFDAALHSASGVALGHGGDRLAAVDNAGHVAVWDIETGHRLAAFPLAGDAPVVGGLAFSRAGDRIALFDVATQKIRLLDAERGGVVGEIATDLQAIEALAFTADDTRIVAKAGRGLRAWAVADERVDTPMSLGAGTVGHHADDLLRALHAGSGLFDVASPAADRFLGMDDPASAARDFGELALADTRTGKVLRRIEEHSINPNGARPISTAFSPDGKRLAVASFDDAMRVYDAAAGTKLFEVGEVKANAYAVNALALSPDGRRLAVGRLASANPDDPGYTILQLWDMTAGTLARGWEGTSNGIGAVAFSADGRQLASASHDKVLRFYDTASGAELGRRPLKQDFYAIALQRGATRGVLVGDDNAVQTLDFASMRTTLVAPASAGRLGALSLSGDGRLAAAVDATGAVRIWRTDGGGHVRAFQGLAGATSAAVGFSADSTAVAGTDGSSLKIWDRRSGAILADLPDDGTARALAFSAGGVRLIEGGDGAAIRVRDAKTGDPIATILPIGTADWAAIAPDGYFSVSRGGRGKLVVVDDTEVRALSLAHPELARSDIVADRLAGRARPPVGDDRSTLRIAVAP